MLVLEFKRVVEKPTETYTEIGVLLVNSALWGSSVFIVHYMNT